MSKTTRTRSVNTLSASVEYAALCSPDVGPGVEPAQRLGAGTPAEVEAGAFVGEQAGQSRCEGLRVTLGNHDPADPVLDELWNRAGVGGHDRHAAGKRLDRTHSDLLCPARGGLRGRCEHSRCAQVTGNVLIHHSPEHVHTVAEACASDLLAELASVGTVTEKDEASRLFLEDSMERLEQVEDAFETLDAAEEHDHRS